MRRFLLLLACAVVLVVRAGIPGNMGHDHVGITVPNVEEAANFFKDVFDCTDDFEVLRGATPTARERGWDKPFKLHPDTSMPHVQQLRCGEAHLAQYIELYEFASPDQVVPERGWQKFSDIGHTYVSFTVKNLADVIEWFENENIPGVEVRVNPPYQFNLRGERVTSTFVTTPWGMMIELTEWSMSKDGPFEAIPSRVDEREGKQWSQVKDDREL